MRDNIQNLYFDRLPSELVVRILQFCVYRDILSFARTSREHAAIVAESVPLQLSIELTANGLKVTPQPSTGNKDCKSLLKELQQYRNAWLDLDLSPPIRQHFRDERMLLWELRDNAFIRAFSRHRTSVVGEQPDSLLVSPLGVVDQHTEINFGVEFSEFTLDLSQDLVVIVGEDTQNEHHAWVRLCSSITGQAHPRAKNPVLPVELGSNIPVNAFLGLALEIKDDVIAVKFASSPSRLYEILVWNWKSGALLNRISSNNGICDFVFLDGDRLVLWSAFFDDQERALNSVSLLVYEPICSVGVRHDFRDGETFKVSTFPELSPALVLQFPELSQYSGVSPRGFLLRADPGPDRNYSRSLPFSHSASPTLGLTMSVFVSGQLHPLRVFVDVQQIIGHLERLHHEPSSTLSWYAWGEEATRWFQTETEPNHWICWMFGSRFVIGTGHQPENISVLDFHPATIRRYSDRRRDTYVTSERSPDYMRKREELIRGGRWLHALNMGDANPGSGWPDESSDAAASENAVVVDIVGTEIPTTIPYFEQPVISRLPYRIVTRVRPVEKHEGWLIDGNHLIGIDFRFGVSGASQTTVYVLGHSDETS